MRLAREFVRRHVGTLRQAITTTQARSVSRGRGLALDVSRPVIRIHGPGLVLNGPAILYRDVHVTKEHQPHLTNAQFRFLRRAIAGEWLPLSRFQRSAPTLAALLRKGCLETQRDFGNAVAEWTPTVRGRSIAAAHGKSPHRED
jgi:hypothetical protein